VTFYAVGRVIVKAVGAIVTIVTILTHGITSQMTLFVINFFFFFTFHHHQHRTVCHRHTSDGCRCTHRLDIHTVIIIVAEST